MKDELMREKYMKLFGWDSNPFVFKIMPELFVGYDGEISSLISSVSNGSKFCLIVGPTGSGKTTMMKNIISKLHGYARVFYVPKPPNDPVGWKKLFTEIVKPGVLHRIFRRNSSKDITIFEVGEWVNKKSRGKRLLLLVDECHESNKESLEWLRTLTDQVDNLSLVMAGLPVFEQQLMEDLETLRRRVETRVELTNLTMVETRELIKKRVEWMGGDDVKPFTSNSIQFIYDRTNGFPREILRVCNDLVQKAAEKNVSTVDTDFMAESARFETRVSIDSAEDLPYRQKSILRILAGGKAMTPTQVVREMDPQDYTDAGNAVRSVNNVLRRLLRDKMVTREREGKAFKYKISPKFQTMFINA